MADMYRTIKKQKGERFAKTIRSYDNGIFDIPALDRIVRYAGDEAEPLLAYLTSLKDVDINEQTTAPEDPFVLLDRAGYTATYADTLDKQNAIDTYFAPSERLCTFNDPHRYENYYIVNAVRKDVDSIRRADFKNPTREDAYDTSVLSIQIRKKGGHISIKNKYNHTVQDPDNTFSSTPDRIIDGLSTAFKAFFNVDFAQTVALLSV